MEVVEETSAVSLFDSVMQTEPEPIIIAAPVLEKNDIYAPLRTAIAEYDAILTTHAQIAATKDQEIADYNNQVAVAKAAAKKALDERKALESEMDRVKQMKELFALQLAK